MLLLAITAWLRALARLWRAGDWSCCARTPGKQQRHSSLDCDASHATAGCRPSHAAVCWIQRALLRMGTRSYFCGNLIVRHLLARIKSNC